MLSLSNPHSREEFGNYDLSIKRIVVSEEDLNELPEVLCECDICGVRVKTRANLRAHQVKTHKIIKVIVTVLIL